MSAEDARPDEHSGSAESLCLPADLLSCESSLVLGIGNAGRQDDGLGWAYVDGLEACLSVRSGPKPQLRHAYQLNLEDADLIHHYRRVLFVDATKDSAVDTFTVTRPHAKMDLTFTSHALSVPAILATARQCFDFVPEAYLLAIRGYQWELAQGLSDAALHNLEAALHATVDTAAADR